MASGLSAGAARPAPMVDFLQAEGELRDRVRDEPGNAEARFVLGLLAHRDGRHAEAVDHIAAAIGLRPDNADFHHGLSLARAALGQLDEALAAHRQALRLRPGFPEAHREMDRLLARRGRVEEAAATPREAPDGRPDSAASLLGRAETLGTQGKLDEAAELLGDAGRRWPEDAAVAAALARVDARRGRFDAAVLGFLDALRRRPDDPDLYNELGIAYARQDRLEAAAAAYRDALRLRPDHADAHNNLGNALRLLGRIDEAIASYHEALKRRPDFPEGYNNLGIALRLLGRLDEAIACYRKALDRRPTYVEAHGNLGLALAARGQLEAAVVSFEHAARLRPDSVECLVQLADALADLGRLDEAVARYHEAIRLRPGDPGFRKNLGVALARREKFEEAIAAYREALRLRPAFPDACNDLGIALARLNRQEEAIAAYREALRLRPNYPEALNNLGNSLRVSGEFEASLAYYRRALELRPEYADAHNNLGIALAEMGRFEEASASYTRCLELRPGHVDAHLNRALTWLRKGDFRRGWAEYEWRWKKRGPDRPMVQPRWNGSDPAGLRFLLTTEQGFGDTIQFIRYAAELKRRGAAETILECPEPLVPLMGRCPGVDRVVPRGRPLPPHDVHCPLLTLPGLMGSLAPEHFPREVPYLHLDPAAVERWRRELEQYPGFRVGINWQGNPGYGGDRHRSIPLAHFEPLARVPGVVLLSLQKNHGSEQLAGVEGRFPVVEIGSRLDGASGPFLDTAAVMRNLDLFITSDTAVAHLAGALGVPTWLALSAAPDWRWMLGREDNPWYPATRLFRQAEYLVWPPVFERMAAELSALVTSSRRSAPIRAEVSPGELLDKLTILQIKAERFTDAEKLRNVRVELAALIAARDRALIPSAELAALVAELRGVNETLWQVEDDIRACEAAGDFGPRFVELSRSVYRHNDRRAAVKRRINDLLGAVIVEEKCYASYQPAASMEGGGVGPDGGR